MPSTYSDSTAQLVSLRAQLAERERELRVQLEEMMLLEQRCAALEKQNKRLKIICDQQLLDKTNSSTSNKSVSIPVDQILAFVQQQCTGAQELRLMQSMLHTLTDDSNDAHLRKRINNLTLKPQVQQVNNFHSGSAYNDVHDNSHAFIRPQSLPSTLQHL